MPCVPTNNHPEGLPFNNTFLTQNAHDVYVVILQLDVLEVSTNL